MKGYRFNLQLKFILLLVFISSSMPSHEFIDLTYSKQLVQLKCSHILANTRLCAMLC